MTTTYAPTQQPDPQPDRVGGISTQPSPVEQSTLPHRPVRTRRSDQPRVSGLQRLLSWLAVTGPKATEHVLLQGPNGSPLWTEGVHPPR